ncbi:hypothetical protein KY284_012933 [Solanum tuberosum]|nr:hypothetical protein KY284_012933 [Solanum tuberosum]
MILLTKVGDRRTSIVVARIWTMIFQVVCCSYISNTQAIPVDWNRRKFSLTNELFFSFFHQSSKIPYTTLLDGNGDGSTDMWRLSHLIDAFTWGN